MRVRRALGTLGRKGYSSGVAMQAIQTVLAEESEQHDRGPEPGGPSLDDDLGDTMPEDAWI